MFSLFKKKVPLAQYCYSVLNTIFCEDMTQHFLRFKSICQDSALANADQQHYLDEMRGAHVELFSMVVNKHFNDFEMSMAKSKCIDAFLTKEFGSVKLRETARTYNIAFGRSSSDGVMEMAKLMSLKLTDNQLSQDTVDAINGMFYTFISSVMKTLVGTKLTY